MKKTKTLQKTTIQPKTTTPRRPPTLRLSPTAWAKLLFLRDAGETEIGGFGIAGADDLLRIEDIALVFQTCTPVAVEFDDAAVADFFDDQVDLGRQPAEFGRLWIHTHPGNSAQPSGTDEETFARVFGGTDWAVMFNLARGGQTYARLRYHVGPGADVELPVEIDYSQPFFGSDEDRWQDEYDRSVREPLPVLPASPRSRLKAAVDEGLADEWLTEDLLGTRCSADRSISLIRDCRMQPPWPRCGDFYGFEQNLTPAANSLFCWHRFFTV